MERDIAERLARELKIDKTQVTREYYEILILKGLSSLPCSDYLIFKGGSALRLAYGSPRFSEDLDFSMTKDCFGDKFSDIVRKIVTPIPDSGITDSVEKYRTYLAEIKITKDYLGSPFRIKIEVSKRVEKDYKWHLLMLKSQSSIYSVLFKVATLQQLYIDKQLCLKERVQSKDLFDLWYISEVLKRPYNPEVEIDKKILRRDLRKFLPIDFHKVIEEL
ncbi:MAG: nucleotidyl transferase AbiEii/AbiGii toxin family protein [candidate division WOR-3 bacterium]|nr:nucleotidyl transferase AbiEii/AbiGii toxin family protein [candidate division WOR-3 bacterium]